MPKGQTLDPVLVESIIAAFDAGETSGAALEARFAIPRSTIYGALRRSGRKLRTRAEANADADKQARAEQGRKKYWTPERRAAFGDAMRAGHAAAKAITDKSESV